MAVRKPFRTAGPPPEVLVLRRIPWLRLARALWVGAAVLALGVFLVSVPAYIAILHLPNRLHGERLAPTSSPMLFALNVMVVLTSMATVLLSLGLARLLFRRRPADGFALLVSFYLLLHGVAVSGPLEMLDTFWPGVGTRAYEAMWPVFWSLLIPILVLFPDGRVVFRWTKWLLLLVVPVAPFIFSLASLHSSTPNPLAWISAVFLLVVWLGALYIQIYRYRHVSGQVERQQAKWLIFGAVVWVVLIMVANVPYGQIENLPDGAPLPWWIPAGTFLWSLSLAALPLSLTVAVLRHRLWDIDLIVNRALVYGALTVSVVVGYILVVGSLSVLLQTQGNLLISLLATGLIAALFDPLRRRLQRGVNRLMFGERDDPVAVLSHLGQRLETAIAADTMLPALVETVAQALKLPYVAIALHPRDDETAVVAAYGRPVPRLLPLPLVYQGEPVGTLRVAPRSPDEPFDPADRQLLEAIARQAGATLHALQLAADLQRSRQQLVTTREEERRRIRRDLHDGLGPLLASLTLQSDTARELVRSQPAEAEALLNEITTQAQSAIRDIRRLVYNLRPPALDELGLVGALRTYVAGCQPGGGQITVEASEPLHPLPAAVEVAAYRIAQEAITNVIRHAGASRCTVRLQRDPQALHLAVTDNGRGLPADRQMGVGLMSMRERAAELGGDCVVEANPTGGTRVRARLPLSPEGSER